MFLHRIRKTKLVWILSMLMLLSCIHSGQVTAASIYLPSVGVPLSPATYKSNMVWRNDDISTSEIIGIRRAGALLEYSQRTKRRQSCHETHVPFFGTLENRWIFHTKTAAKQSLVTGIDSKYKIIRYIHDQDGEKDDLFHFI